MRAFPPPASQPSSLVLYWPWCFSLGVVLPLFLPALLSWPILGSIALSSLLLGYIWFQRIALIWLSFITGFCLATWTGYQLLEQTIATAQIKQDSVITGRIVGLPSRHERMVRFNFIIESSENLNLKLPSKTRLSWYGSHVPDLATGQRWQFTVRLKPAHGSLNPGAFDYESWLFSQAIRSTGYIRTKNPITQLKPVTTWFNTQAFRAELADFIETNIRGPQHGILSALGVGIRSQLSDQDWQLLQATGTIHLVAISGLHLGLVAGFFYFLGQLFWRHLGLRWLHFPAHHAGAISSVLAGAVYASLAGFSIPTLRALWMLITAALIILSHRNTPLRFSFGLVLAVVLLLDPLAPLSIGFWLSFGAVAVILYASVQSSPRAESMGARFLARLKTYAHIQWAIFLGLAPILLLAFQKLSIVSLLANALAIPIIALLVVPMVLLAMVLYAFGGLAIAQSIFTIAECILSWLWHLLNIMAQWPWAVWQQAAPPLWAVLMALIGTGILLLPRAFPGRWLGIAWLMPLILIKPTPPELGSARITVLDVGQGLASVVQTHTHTLIYDVGPAFSSGYDAGKDVVLPFLRHQGIRQVDGLVISHANSDHMGGLTSVLSALPVSQIWGSAGVQAPQKQACEAGQSWQWDGVRFSFLHPSNATPFEDNNASCVLRIEAGPHAALLTGDIEKEAEGALLDRYVAKPQILQADFLQAPHHGSKSSSTNAFLNAVNPRIVVIPAGYWNRFRHPHPSVVERYQDLGVTPINTATTGAAWVHLGKDELKSGAYRTKHPRYWFQSDETE